MSGCPTRYMHWRCAAYVRETCHVPRTVISLRGREAPGCFFDTRHPIAHALGPTTSPAHRILREFAWRWHSLLDDCLPTSQLAECLVRSAIVDCRRRAVAIACAFNAASFWKSVAIVGASVPVAVLFRIAVETTADPTTHNLWPFEVIIALPEPRLLNSWRNLQLARSEADTSQEITGRIWRSQ